MSYREFWRRAVWNFVLGVLVSVVPAFAFYSLAFDYNPAQLRLLAWLALPGIAAFLIVDLSLLRIILRPLRPVLQESPSPAELERGLERLLALPSWVLPRIFGPHAIVATAVFNLLVVWANRTQALGIPERDFWIYWLLNLSVVPVGHAVYEYHATERLIQVPLARLLERREVRLAPHRLVRLPLATRLFLFSALLAMAPIVIVVFIFYQRWQAAGLPLPMGLIYQLTVVGAALTLLWILLLALVSREVREQTRAITGVLDRIAAGELSAAAPVQSTSEFGRIAVAVNEMAAGLRERQQIRDLFGAYMTRELAAQLLEPNRLAATERRVVTILFVDLRDFTALSSRYEAETVVELLNQFLTEAVAAIAAARGHVNKFLGDGVLAVFGAPVELPDAADAALRAAVEIRRRLEELNQRLEARSLPRLRMGAALHTGEVIVGTIGVPEHKLEYTVIGETVNLASRLEALNKQLGTEILLSQETAAQLKESFPLKRLPPTEVRGIPRPVELFTWAGPPGKL
ncbi:MAG: adenylate/guanylate cyclase domain-containing protein [Candidatus Acidiferrales bacterium]